MKFIMPAELIVDGMTHPSVHIRLGTCQAYKCLYARQSLFVAKHFASELNRTKVVLFNCEGDMLTAWSNLLVT